MTEEAQVEDKQAISKAEAMAALLQMPDVPASRSWWRDNFLLTLLAFIVVWWLVMSMMQVFSLTLLLILLAVLLIHEGGHYLTMHFFGYKNLRMFFIPLFGAAVSGNGLGTVTQESLIYLMGPLPGIIIGLVCGAVYQLTGQEFFLTVSQLFVVINAINLLPLYPLDGGRFLFDILPRFTYQVQWLLQILLLVGITIVTEQTGLIKIVSLVPILFASTFYLYRRNDISHSLLKRRLPLDTPGDAIPPEAIEPIVDAVQVYYKSKGSEIAEIGWDTWTRLKTKRPGWIETLCLLAIYAITFASVWVARALFLT